MLCRVAIEVENIRQAIISCSNCSNLTCHPSGSGVDLSFLMAVRLSDSESFSLDSAFFNSLSLTELAGVTVKLLNSSPSGRDFQRSFDSATCRTSTTSLPTVNVLLAPFVQNTVFTGACV